MIKLFILHDCHFSVPSKAPENVRVASHGLNEFLVEWDPLSVQYVNGLLLGYSVYYKDARYYYYLEKTVNTGSPDESHVILTGIETGKRYQISVTAFTSRGPGPRSPNLYVTKGKCLTTRGQDIKQSEFHVLFIV